MKGQVFILTTDHLKLIRKMNVGWDGGECGAPTIDCKRPYGNSDVVRDIAKILEWEIIDDEYITNEQRIRAMKLHQETETALQICLYFGTFETGTYTREFAWDDWEKAS